MTPNEHMLRAMTDNVLGRRWQGLGRCSAPHARVLIDR